MPTPSFLDFDLQINRLGKKFQAQVLESPAGQASSEFTLPLSNLELENFFLRVGRPRKGVRRIDSPEMDTIKKVGGRLFDAVFCEDILALLSSSLVIAQSQGKGLRIRLRQTSAESGDLPWEYLYDARQNRFLALALQTPIIRYLDVPQASQALTVDLPLKVLVMVSSPSDYPPLDVETEYSRLSNALQPLAQKGLVNLERIDNATFEALQRQLRTGKHHIFQFIGHGGFNPGSQEGVLILENENNLGKIVSGQELGWLLHNYPSLRLVVLNACEGARSGRQDPFAGVAQSLVQQGIPAVIAMQFEITDQAALIFSQNFYTAITEGNPVDTALSEARMSIFTSGNDIEWGTPVLFTRSSDGRLFDIQLSHPLPQPVEPPFASRSPEQPPAAPPPVIEMPPSAFRLPEQPPAAPPPVIEIPPSAFRSPEQSPAAPPPVIEIPPSAFRSPEQPPAAPPPVIEIPISASRWPEQSPAAPPPVTAVPASGAPPKSFIKRVPLWTWVLASLFLLGTIAVGTIAIGIYLPRIVLNFSAPATITPSRADALSETVTNPSLLNPTQVQTSAPSDIPRPSPTQTQISMESDISQPTDAPTLYIPPSPIATNPPLGPAILVLDQGYYCRGGADETYPELWTFHAGAELEIQGQSGTGWYLIRFHDPGTRKCQCWIGGGTVSGDASQIPYSDWTGEGYECP
ncbi:MAG: hypothetical protein A2Z16_11795 [Chloroflexi bacterium RBG_16_54_18]|nr:MAG: hypothetical protein A2Z16_11795 [Chloroflexi bacterium RBG_16_54_18]